jgi:hypothetical protein
MLQLHCNLHKERNLPNCNHRDFCTFELQFTANTIFAVVVALQPSDLHKSAAVTADTLAVYF